MVLISFASRISLYVVAHKEGHIICRCYYCRKNLTTHIPTLHPPFKVGDLVIATNGADFTGGLAEYALVETKFASKAPPDVEPVQASVLSTSPVTAMYVAKVSEGVLVTVVITVAVVVVVGVFLSLSSWFVAVAIAFAIIAMVAGAVVLVFLTMLLFVAVLAVFVMPPLVLVSLLVLVLLAISLPFMLT